MKKVILLCNQGMSTSALVAKMSAAAKNQGLDYSIAAYAVDTAKTNAADADVILLGPQVRHLYQEVVDKFESTGIPIAVIDQTAYGMMDGEKVLKTAIKMMKAAK